MLSDKEFYARGLARSRYHDRLFAEGKPRPTNEQFDEGWEAARQFYTQTKDEPSIDLSPPSMLHSRKEFRCAGCNSLIEALHDPYCYYKGTVTCHQVVEA